MSQLINNARDFYSHRYEFCRRTYGPEAHVTLMYKRKLDGIDEGRDKKSVKSTFNNRPLG